MVRLQYYSIELPVVMEMFHVCTVQGSNHEPHVCWALEMGNAVKFKSQKDVREVNFA